MGHKKGVQTSLYLIISRKIASKYPDNPWLIRCVSLPNKEILEIDPKYKNWSRYDGHIQCACGGPFGTHPTLKRGFQCEKCEEPFPNGGALASGGTHLASEPDSFFGFDI
jgi:hypothetical protein